MGSELTIYNIQQCLIVLLFGTCQRSSTGYLIEHIPDQPKPMSVHQPHHRESFCVVLESACAKPDELSPAATGTG